MVSKQVTQRQDPTPIHLSPTFRSTNFREIAHFERSHRHAMNELERLCSTVDTEAQNKTL